MFKNPFLRAGRHAIGQILRLPLIFGCVWLLILYRWPMVELLMAFRKMRGISQLQLTPFSRFTVSVFLHFSSQNLIVNALIPFQQPKDGFTGAAAPQAPNFDGSGTCTFNS